MERTKRRRRVFALFVTAVAVTVLTALVVSAATVPVEPYGKGDINGDGTITAVDYLLAKRMVLSTFTGSQEHYDRADLNSDGAVNAQDYIMLKRFILVGIAASCPHEYEYTRTEPTCAKSGMVVKKCKLCGHDEVVEYLDALGHDYKTSAVKATCEHGGYTLHKCSRCGDSYKTDETKPGAHDYKATTVKATCEHGGYTLYKCSVCGDSYKANETDPAPHTFKRTTVEATCEDEGYTRCKCKVCGYTCKEDIVPAKGHTKVYQSTVIKAATLTSKGLERYTCLRCNQEVTVETDILAFSKSFTLEVLTEINKLRAAKGSPPLELDPVLTKMGNEWLADLIGNHKQMYHDLKKAPGLQYYNIESLIGASHDAEYTAKRLVEHNPQLLLARLDLCGLSGAYYGDMCMLSDITALAMCTTKANKENMLALGALDTSYFTKDEIYAARAKKFAVGTRVCGAVRGYDFKAHNYEAPDDFFAEEFGYVTEVKKNGDLLVLWDGKSTPELIRYGIDFINTF